MVSQAFHQWVLTTCTVLQTVAVTAGIAFAVVQVIQFQFSQDLDRREATYELMRKLREEPLRSIVDSLDDSSIKLAGATGTREMLPDFAKRTWPLAAFSLDLTDCLSIGKCDPELAKDRFCPIVTRYWAARKAAVDDGTMPWDRAWLAMVTLGGRCDSESDALAAAIYKKRRLEGDPVP